MKTFFTNIIIISTFFISIGAIGDSVWKALNSKEVEYEVQRIRIIKIEKSSAENIKFQMILPNFDELEKVEKPIAENRVLILRQSEIVE